MYNKYLLLRWANQNSLSSLWFWCSKSYKLGFYVCLHGQKLMSQVWISLTFLSSKTIVSSMRKYVTFTLLMKNNFFVKRVDSIYNKFIPTILCYNQRHFYILKYVMMIKENILIIKQIYFTTAFYFSHFKSFSLKVYFCKL